MMKPRDYIIGALLVAILILWISRPKPEALDFTKQYDSLRIEITKAGKLITTARKDSVLAIAEIDHLRARNKAISDDRNKLVQSYKKKINSLKVLKLPQYDSITLLRYGEPLTKITARGARLLYEDIYKGEEAVEILTRADQSLEIQLGIIDAQRKIIKSDSVQIANLRRIIESNTERSRLNAEDYDEIEKQLRKTRRGNTLLKIAAPVLFLVGLLISA